MRLEVVEIALARIADLIARGQFEELETDTLEIKPVPPTGQDWDRIHQSACAFLNTRGGIIIFGVRETGRAADRRYEFTGWHAHAEPKVAQFAQQFTDMSGVRLSLNEAFPAPSLIAFLGGHVMVQLVDELPADRKYACYKAVAYRRILTGDHPISASEIARQREFVDEARYARELQPVEDATLASFDIDALNQYIVQLNRLGQVETIKSDVAAAVPFLDRKGFYRDGRATTLGVLVCGRHPDDFLGFRCHVHGYVDVEQRVAQDKQDFVGNILPLMESSIGYIHRNIQVAVSPERGGTPRPQYPEQLIRETVNNALAHRDYAINRQVIIVIKPGEHVSVQNPGRFPAHLLIEAIDDRIPVRRILPEAKPRNPKLADVLRVYRKWEGRGIGMATLVNLALTNEIDLPCYRFGTEEVTLFLRAGRLLDDRMERLFESFDRYISEKLVGGQLTPPQKLVLSYLIKSEWAHRRVQYSIMLTPDNNHFGELDTLAKAGLIAKHPASTPQYPVYVADRELVRDDQYLPELRGIFGINYDALDAPLREILAVVYRHERFSSARAVSAKATSFILWYERGGRDDIKAFDLFYRRVRRQFNKLEADGFVGRVSARGGYVLDRRAGDGVLGTDARPTAP